MPLLTLRQSPLVQESGFKNWTAVKTTKISTSCCKDARIFLETTPKRVHLLDYTDLISDAREGIRPVDIISVISLRSYVILGKQVQEWRAAGQVGKVDGLRRGNIVEPNQELVAYDWN